MMYTKASDIMYLYFSWLSDDPIFGLTYVSLIIDHRTLIKHFKCSLQNVGQKKAVAWNDRAIKGEEALWG